MAGLGFRVSGCRVQGFWSRVFGFRGLGFRVLFFRVQRFNSLGFIGFRVEVQGPKLLSLLHLEICQTEN